MGHWAMLAAASLSVCCARTLAAPAQHPTPNTQHPSFGRSLEVDPAFPYYQDRSPASIAAEIRANGYRVVRYILTADSSVDPKLLAAFHNAGIGVWYATFGNGVYTTKDLPAGWRSWRMVTRSDLEGKPLDDGYTRLCLNNPDYRAWKKARIARMLRAHPFDGVDIMEPHWPEYPGASSPAYACFCPHCLAAFRRMFPREQALPDILHADSPRSPARNPKLWQSWLQFRRASLTAFLNDLVNGKGGIRAAAPKAKVCVWTLALGQPDGLKRVREDSGEDAADIARVVRPDLHCFQTHWPDWTRADLPPDYVERYRPFIAEIRAAAPKLPLMIQADIGSQKQNRRSWQWVHRFESACAKLGVGSTTVYEYFIGDYMYTDPPRVAEAWRESGGLALSFTKRLDPASAGDLAHYAPSAGRVTAVRVDGSVVHLTLSASGMPAREPVSVTVTRVADGADRRLFSDRPPAVLERQTVTIPTSAPHTNAAYPASAALKRAADALLTHQAPDGAIMETPISVPGDTRIIPYNASLASLGLVAAYVDTRDRRYLDAARQWVAWYEQHMNPDGTVYDYTGRPGAWKPTGDYDSTDSYAATWLWVVDALDRAAPDAHWLAERRPAILQALDAIRLTLQPDGLTLAKPKWPVMYTMDNTETLRGLRSAARVLLSLGDTKAAGDAARLGDRMERALNTDLWDPARESWRIGIQPDGGKMEGLEKWYPDVMANLMAIGWQPLTDRNRALYARLKPRFAANLPETVRGHDDLDRLDWWGYAARTVGDTELLGRVRRALAAWDPSAPAIHSPSLLGHLCRLLAKGAE